ncbi:MAG TPA: hypothetical protein VFQ54_08695 [Thermomicrobiales bacterium]|nr:hypothetical protein [Thermomicrobiales bacterium]
MTSGPTRPSNEGPPPWLSRYLSAMYDLRDAITVVRIHAQLAQRRLARGIPGADSEAHSLAAIELASREAEWAIEALELEHLGSSGSDTD